MAALAARAVAELATEAHGGGARTRLWRAQLPLRGGGSGSGNVQRGAVRVQFRAVRPEATSLVAARAALHRARNDEPDESHSEDGEADLKDEGPRASLLAARLGPSIEAPLTLNSECVA